MHGIVKGFQHAIKVLIVLTSASLFIVMKVSLSCFSYQRRRNEVVIQ